MVSGCETQSRVTWCVDRGYRRMTPGRLSFPTGIVGCVEYIINTSPFITYVGFIVLLGRSQDDWPTKWYTLTGAPNQLF